MSNQTVVDMSTLRQAIEQRNAELLISLYADTAHVQIIDSVHQPSSPLELRGKQAIADYLSDICRREMTHRIMDEVIGENRLSFNEACQYPGGERVLAASVLDLQNGKIIRQITVQAWDA
jgi:hypothetical protein